MGRGPTLRSLIEVLDRVIGRGVVVESDVPVSPALAGLRRAAGAREAAECAPAPELLEATSLDRSPAQPDTRVDEGVRDPPRDGRAPGD